MTADLLLDSNAFVFWMRNDPSLSVAARSRLASRRPAALSVATIWELEIKVRNGKLDLPPAAWDGLSAGALFEVLPIDMADALAAARLPAHHRDPFDRMIVAQALRRSMTVVTRDPVFSRYGVPVLTA